MIGFLAVVAAAMRHAEAEFPRESCGLVVDGRYVPCANQADDPERRFLIGRREWRRAATALLHSHPHPLPAVPSAADMQGQSNMALPWGIVPVGADGLAGAPFWWGDQVPAPPLVGRAYRHGVTDCYSVIRDWYRLERDVLLPDVARAWNWWRDTAHPDLYERHFREVGFDEVDPASAAVGDGVLIQIRGVVAHAGVIVADGVMLHHPGADRPYDPTSLSRREPIARWLPYVRRVVRRKAVGPCVGARHPQGASEALPGRRTR